MRDIETRINNYFHSEEADIQIKTERIITSILVDISQELKEKVPEEKDLITIFKKKIPRNLYAEDPEILEYSASSILAIIDNERRWARVNQLIEKLKPLLPQNLRNNNDFLKNLQDDVWEINEDWIAIESSGYTKSYSIDASVGDKTKLTVKQTGMPIIYMDLDRKIMRSQVFSLSIAIFLVFILLAFRLRSLVGGLISISPIILTILVTFTLMAIFDIPLDIVTVLIGSVAVGIGIDYTIHFISRFKVEFAQGKTELEALDKTLETTGKAIISNALSVMMGFLVLVLGNIVPMQRFGYLIALTMIISASGSIIVLPALILVTKAGFIGRFDQLTNNLATKLKQKITRR
jgi:predicted RND superfamily exporter protein